MPNPSEIGNTTHSPLLVGYGWGIVAPCVPGHMLMLPAGGDMLMFWLSSKW